MIHTTLSFMQTTLYNVILVARYLATSVTAQSRYNNLNVSSKFLAQGDKSFSLRSSACLSDIYLVHLFRKWYSSCT